jgi:hypothetical protein
VCVCRPNEEGKRRVLGLYAGILRVDKSTKKEGNGFFFSGQLKARGTIPGKLTGQQRSSSRSGRRAGGSHGQQEEAPLSEGQTWLSVSPCFERSVWRVLGG